MKAKRSKKPDCITARSIELVDVKGKTRIFLDAGDGNGFACICLFGENGRSIQLSCQPGGSMAIAIHDKHSEATFGMSAQGDAGIDIRDRKGFLGTLLGSNNFTPGEHHLSVFQDGQLAWTTRKRKKKRTTEK
ncbi:MAG TPA: hypothetical protein VG733_02270 [Chthoniobacteraceae bacterium]|nr:hypothetical protein [Chthoniobacteraceae bacterium]